MRCCSAKLQPPAQCSHNTLQQVPRALQTSLKPLQTLNLTSAERGCTMATRTRGDREHPPAGFGRGSECSCACGERRLTVTGDCTRRCSIKNSERTVYTCSPPSTVFLCGKGVSGSRAWGVCRQAHMNRDCAVADTHTRSKGNPKQSTIIIQMCRVLTDITDQASGATVPKFLAPQSSCSSATQASWSSRSAQESEQSLLL